MRRVSNRLSEDDCWDWEDSNKIVAKAWTKLKRDLRAIGLDIDTGMIAIGFDGVVFNTDYFANLMHDDESLVGHLRTYQSNHSVSNAALARRLRVTPPTVASWIAGNTIPCSTNLSKIARLLSSAA